MRRNLQTLTLALLVGWCSSRSDAAEAEDVLGRWEAAAAGLAPLTQARKDRAWPHYRARHTGHEFSLICEFRGPVLADDLLRRYEWEVDESSPGRLVLTAVPRDVEERLFYGEFRVTLDGRTYLPEAVEFADRRGVAKAGPIQLVTADRREPGGNSGVTTAGFTSPGPPPPRLLDERQITAAKPAAPAPLSPELEDVLKSWEAAHADVRTMRAEFRRFTYDKVFGIERRCEGDFYFEAPDKGRIDLRSAKIGQGEVSPRSDPLTGRPFTLEGDCRQRWVWTDRELLMINDAQRKYEVFPLPAGRRDKTPQPAALFPLHPPQDWLPLVFGIQADDLRQRFDWTLLKRTERQVWLSARPRDRRGVAYQKIKIILDAQTWLPTAVQYTDPSSNLETVYAFTNMAVNAAPSDENPLQPSLEGYRLK